MSEERSQTQKFFYFVNRQKYETDQEVVTGALIRAKIPSLGSSDFLFLENRGSGTDELVADDRKVVLRTDAGPPQFYTVPPAVAG